MRTQLFFFQLPRNPTTFTRHATHAPPPCLSQEAFASTHLPRLCIALDHGGRGELAADHEHDSWKWVDTAVPSAIGVSRHLSKCNFLSTLFICSLLPPSSPLYGYACGCSRVGLHSLPGGVRWFTGPTSRHHTDRSSIGCVFECKVTWSCKKITRTHEDSLTH